MALALLLFAGTILVPPPDETKTGKLVLEMTRLAHALPEIAAKYQATGMPWVKSDIQLPPPDPSQNADPLLRKIAGRLWDLDVADLSSDIEEGRPAIAEKKLSAYKKVFQLAIQASNRPRLDDGHDLDLGALAIDGLGTSRFKVIVRALAIRAELDAEEGRAADAAQDLLAARKLAALLNQEPSLISMLVRIASDSITDRAAQHCDGFLAHDPKGLEAINAAMSAQVEPISFGQALRGEAFSEIAMTRNVNVTKSGEGLQEEDKYTPKNPKHIVRSGFPSDRPSQALMAAYLKIWTAAAHAIKADDPVAIQAAFDKWTDDQAKHPAGSSEFTDTTAGLIPQMEQAFQRSAADKAVTKALGEALLFRCNHGRYPKTVADLAGTWIDPFTGQPLRIAHLNGGIRIYSLGVKKVDYHGLARTELPEGTDPTAWNIVAAYPPVKPGVSGIAHEK
jgi:hypothetical protein